MNDLISRQAASDAMAELQGRASTKAELKGIHKAWKRIKQLPSAQLDLCDGCDRYGASCVGEGCGKLEPEIIRCCDCISYQEGIDIDGKPFTRCNGSVRTYGHTLPDWFCADAERRTDGTEQP